MFRRWLAAILEIEDGSFQVYKDKGGQLKQKKIKRTRSRSPAFSQRLVNSESSTIGQIDFFTALGSKDKQILGIISTWAASCVHFAQLSSQLQTKGEESELFIRQRKLNAFLLDVAKSIFQNIVSMDNVILKVMNFAQKLVSADRASLFLVDNKTKELYARIFDVGQGDDEHVKINSDGSKEIRFSMNKGIAGYVASSGEVLNIENAYDDDRFNDEVDSKTGYHTTTILCMPIFIRTSVIGVVQMVNKADGVFNKADEDAFEMVNKADGVFNKADEDAFEMFAVYCGLALHHAKLYDKIRRSEQATARLSLNGQKYRVALEVLAYHSVCNRDEVLRLRQLEQKEKIHELETFDFNGIKLSEVEKPLYAVYMFKTLFDDKFRFDQDDLTRFMLTLSSQLQTKGEESELFIRQRKLNAFLLDVAKSIFQDIVSMDNVILKVMNFAQKLVSADRASLFLVDNKTKELDARIFDVGQGDDEHVKINSDGSKEIRFSMNKGIAGYVASSGEVLNIENAYDDDRFNDEVDSKTGYHTTTILCMPIFIRTSVIGVVQMVNKADGVFNKADEDAFEMFAVYCGLALHHAKLYDKIRRSEQKYRVALEVLAYHSVCNRDEVLRLRQLEQKEKIHELETFDFNGIKLSEVEKPLYAVYMFKTLFDDKFRFDQDDLTRFMLTVRKNYRRVAYHNWAHGWSVAHAMFVLLNSTDIFTPFEALALFISCICHDLDHRGKNNAYMKNMSTPLAAIYSTSVMEHHHFNQTVTILQQDGHNILKSMCSEEYKRALAAIKHCILATDLALFFPNRARVAGLTAEGSFDIKDVEHRKLLQGILMTGCDLIASAKPWSIQTETVKVIFEEFYEQGDAERVNGKEPIAMMDRTKAHELPQMQVGFMRGICVPCYDVISTVIPEVGKLRDQCEFNAKMWEQLAEESKQIDEDKKQNGNGNGN